jgi:quercetin dioxygenase-like cupin family protein
MDNDKAIILGSGEGKMIPVPGHKITQKVSGAETNGAFSMLEVELAGDGPPLHIHNAEDESFYVLEGEMVLQVGDRRINATAGSFTFVPRGTIHTFARARQQTARFLVTYSPAGFEQFFDEAVDLDVTDTESYVAKADTLAEKYNMEIVGPPLEG